jgi:hypothetical protein
MGSQKSAGTKLKLDQSSDCDDAMGNGAIEQKSDRR